MADTLSMISMISFAGAAACLALAIFFFIRFKIPTVIGDLNGKNVRRSIQQMRRENEKSGKKDHRNDKKSTVGIGHPEATSILVEENGTTLLEENACGNSHGEGMRITLIEEVILIHSREIVT